MSKRAVLLVTFTSLLAAACADHQAASADAERELLERRQSEFLAALTARDAEGIAELFSEDAVIHVANMPPIEGRGAIHQFYSNVFGFLNASSATPDALHISLSGDMAYSTGTTSNEFRGAAGPVEYAGKYVIVWRKPTDDWMIAVYGISSNEPEGN